MKKKQRRYPEFTGQFKPRYPFGLLSIPYRLCGKPLTQQERRVWERKGAYPNQAPRVMRRKCARSREQERYV
jgi:hypothetical protein